jgi:hypothetical protein
MLYKAQISTGKVCCPLLWGFKNLIFNCQFSVNIEFPQAKRANLETVCLFFTCIYVINPTIQSSHFVFK